MHLVNCCMTLIFDITTSFYYILQFGVQLYWNIDWMTCIASEINCFDCCCCEMLIIWWPWQYRIECINLYQNKKPTLQGLACSCLTFQYRWIPWLRSFVAIWDKNRSTVDQVSGRWNKVSKYQSILDQLQKLY